VTASRTDCYIRHVGYVFIGELVCYQDYATTISPNITKFRGKVAHGPRKKQLDFGSNHVMLRLGLQLGGCTAILCVGGCVCRVTVRWVYCHTLCGWIYVNRRLLVYNFTTSAALAEVCALLSVILVFVCKKMQISRTNVKMNITEDDENAL